MKTKIVLIALLTFFWGCQTCLKQEDFKELELKSNFTNKDFSHLNGEYKRIIYDLFGNKSISKCSTWFIDGVIKHYSGRLINIKNHRLVVSSDHVKVFTFVDNKQEYQIHIDRDNKTVELLSIGLWDIYKKVEKKKEDITKSVSKPKAKGKKNITTLMKPYIDDGTLPKGNYFIGTASGHGANCLIDSIAQALGVKTTKKDRLKIRGKLNVPEGALPNERKIVDQILKLLDRPETSVYFYSGPHKALDSFTCRHSQAKRIVLVYYTPGHFSPVIFEKE